MLLKHEGEVEFVRQCFKELFADDNGDIDARQGHIDDFIEKINGRIDNYVKGSWKYPQQRNNVIYYLNLWQPESNYIFKSTEATEWANCVEFGDDFGSGSSFSLKKYYAMCDELLQEIKSNATIMELYNARKAKEAQNIFDDDGHILVYDIIYCAKAYNLYKNIPSLHKLTTKERIRLAETAEKREHLIETLTELTEELERLSKDIVLPDITGISATHKKWGKGKIIRQDNSSIEVEFEEGIKKLQYPESINKFIVLDTKEYDQLFEDYMINTNDKKLVEAELTNVKRELDKFTTK